MNRVDYNITQFEGFKITMRDWDLIRRDLSEILYTPTNFLIIILLGVYCVHNSNFLAVVTVLVRKFLFGIAITLCRGCTYVSVVVL